MDTKYLNANQFIDSNHPSIQFKAKQLSDKNTYQTINNCFEFVRDEIKHSYDYQLNPITCKASDVLKHQTGYCYAKSHLLAALLRANNIPSALCYQRLSFDDQGAPYCLHGLNAVYLEDIGWYRIDPRGNKEGINAQFCPPTEQLAFTINLSEEKDIEGYFSEPLPEVIDALHQFNDWKILSENLPDINIG